MVPYVLDGVRIYVTASGLGIRSHEPTCSPTFFRSKFNFVSLFPFNTVFN